jgi:hypothetical protein
MIDFDPNFDNMRGVPNLPIPWNGILTTTESEARLLLERALEEEEFLTDHGIGLPNSLLEGAETAEAVNQKYEEQRLALGHRLAAIAASADWIKLQRIGKSFNHTANSYTHKHRVESWLRGVHGHYHYVTNGSFIAAAIGLGLEWKPSGTGRLNVLFRLIERAPRRGSKLH